MKDSTDERMKYWHNERVKEWKGERVKDWTNERMKEWKDGATRPLQMIEAARDHQGHVPQYPRPSQRVPQYPRRPHLICQDHPSSPTKAACLNTLVAQRLKWCDWLQASRIGAMVMTTRRGWWAYGCVKERNNGRMAEWRSERVKEWKSDITKEWKSEKVKEWKNETMKEWENERMK